ncbi:MAG: hypothetical protein KDG89_02570 [Geminicoccaceae bacterium]|nr:hypothetical protein [Geminicoccaceae bacterium]
MAARPFGQWLFGDIKAHAEANWDDARVLKQVRDELRRRSKPWSQSYAVVVAARLKELAGGAEGADAGLRVRAEQLEKALREAQKRAETAEFLTTVAEAAARAAEARAKQAESRASAADASGYREVGLHPGCADFLLKAARKAFRSEYHPDRFISHFPAFRRDMEERFKHFDAVFDRLLAARAKRAA